MSMYGYVWVCVGIYGYICVYIGMYRYIYILIQVGIGMYPHL